MNDGAIGRTRQIAVVTLAAVAAIELATVAIDLLGSGFHLQLGPLRISSSDPWRPALIGILAAAAALSLGRPALRTPAWVERMPAWSRWCLAAAIIGLNQIPLVWPLFQPGFLAGHDTGAHVTYSYLFDRALSQGQFPVRWVEGIANGRGQPLFNHYQVGLYYIVEGVHLAVPDLSLSLKLAVAACWCTGAWFTFLWFRRLGWCAGVVAAVVFAWSPYLLVDVFVRAAYTEFAALSMAAGVFWALDGLLRTGRLVYVPALAMLSCLVLVCHLPTTLVVAPVAALYALQTMLRGRTGVGRLAAVGAAGLLGAAMAAFYVWPAIAELDTIKIGKLTSGYFDYHQHFVQPVQWITYRWGYAGSGTGAPDQMSRQIGIVQWGWIITAIGTLAMRRPHRASRSTAVAPDLVWWLVMIAISLFLMTGASAAVWEAWRRMAFIQFPWRLLMVPAIACAALAALATAIIPGVLPRVVVVGGTIVLLWGTTHDYLRQARQRPRLTMNIDNPAWRETANGRTTHFAEAGYDPKGAAAELPADVGRWTVTAGEATVTPRVLHDDDVVLEVRTDQGARLAINSRYVPGWTTWIDGRAAGAAIDPSYDVMDVDVPPGTHRVEARYTDTPVRRAANVVSLSGWGVWALAAAFGLVDGIRRRTAASRHERGAEARTRPVDERS